MSGALVITVLREAEAHFGKFTAENHAEVTRWVRERVNERRGVAPAEVVEMPQSWYEPEEPTEDGWR